MLEGNGEELSKRFPFSDLALALPLCHLLQSLPLSNALLDWAPSLTYFLTLLFWPGKREQQSQRLIALGETLLSEVFT